MNVQMSLEAAVNVLGLGNRTTIMLSEKRDNEVVVAQRKIFNEWKKKNSNGEN